MASPLVLLLLAISTGLTTAEDSLLFRETPLACRIQCHAFFHAENSFFYTDCLMPEFDNKCVHMPQPWLIGLFFIAGVAIPVLVVCCIAQLCIACLNSLRE